MADQASPGSDDQWEGKSGDHESYGPYQYNYEYGEYSKRPYGFVSPSFPVCESASAIYAPPIFILDLKPSLTLAPMRLR